jgi:N-acetyl-gamma-glutamyl-phosphate reductase
VANAFGHLASAWPDTRFQSQAQIEKLMGELPRAAVFCAAPHGAAAGLVDSLLSIGAAAGCAPRVVDISADFRFASEAAYEKVYKHAHGAPQRLREFTCALPEHLEKSPTAHVAHPGCFATAMLLASVPLLKLGLVAPTLFVSGITGSTGSGRKPVEGTHHPLRHGDLYAYNALAHRHAPEVTACALAASGVEADFAFVPHSGPFARGIHVTVQGSLRSVRDTAHVLDMLREFYADCPFVRVTDTPPRVKNVATSNYAHLSAVANGRTVAVMCVIDNLTKGAAGGAVQWMNRLFNLPETSGLLAPAPGWT